MSATDHLASRRPDELLDMGIVAVLPQVDEAFIRIDPDTGPIARVLGWAVIYDGDVLPIAVGEFEWINNRGEWAAVVRTDWRPVQRWSP